MSDLLTIGASGARAYQTALSTVADNISNASTAGYTRKTATISELASATSIQAKTTLSGAIVSGITRSTDVYRSADVRQTSTDLARTTTDVTWLDRIQTSLSGSQLSTNLTSFYAAGQTLAADPTSTAARSTMLESATTVANAFRSTGASLDQVASDLDASADSAVSTLNNLSASLATVNQNLGKVPAGSGNAAQLMDQRDAIVEQMSAITDVTMTTDSLGRATVKMGNSTGPTLVDGVNPATVTYVSNASGAVSFAVHRLGDVSSATPVGGSLAGIADSAQKLADTRDALNTVATAFTSSVNAVQAQGEDLNGNAGTAMFATGSSPTDISLALTDPSGIAAASVGGGSRDNSNLAALQASRTSGKFEATVTSLVTDNAAALASRQTVADAQGAIHDTSVAARDAVSGVNLDEEAVNLMRFQQAYSAAGRVIQTSRDIFQTILEIR